MYYNKLFALYEGSVLTFKFQEYYTFKTKSKPKVTLKNVLLLLILLIIWRFS